MERTEMALILMVGLCGMLVLDASGLFEPAFSNQKKNTKMIMNKKYLLTAAILATCCTPLRAEDKVKVEVNKDRDRVVDVDVDRKKTDRPYSHDGIKRHGDMTAAKITKASTLIGMDVKNAANEKLGTIKDVAFDLQTGRIAYAVLGTGGVLGIGDKLIAVPTSAFQCSADQKHLVLNADKAKLEGTAGFDRNNWPNMPSASWGGEVNVDRDLDRDRSLQPRNNAIERRNANDPTVQDLKRQAQDRERGVNKDLEPKRNP